MPFGSEFWQTQFGNSVRRAILSELTSAYFEQTASGMACLSASPGRVRSDQEVSSREIRHDESISIRRQVFGTASLALA